MIDFGDDVSCQSSWFGGQGMTDDDGDRATSNCTGQYPFLLGCLPYSKWHAYDGSYPGKSAPSNKTPNINYQFDGKSCTVQHGSRYEHSEGNKQCCKSPTSDFQCVLRYGTYITVGSISTGISYANCTDPYTLVGCSGWGTYNNLNAIYINDDHQCKVRTSDRNPAYATAICCKLETDSPTPDPTIEPINHPTSIPSAYPSITPTSSPSADPTINPTYVPTTQPSIQPYISPSIFPTDTPSAMASIPPFPAPKPLKLDIEVPGNGITTSTAVIDTNSNLYTASDKSANEAVQATGNTYIYLNDMLLIITAIIICFGCCCILVLTMKY